MANTYTQIYIQLVFATKGRENKIHSEIRDEIEKYITGIFTNKEQKKYCNIFKPRSYSYLF